MNDVIGIVKGARGSDHSASPHHWDPDTVVHVFRPTIEGTRWYVKAYFIEEPEGSAVFISIHR